MSDEPKRRGRPPKNYLHEDHHFKPVTETPDNDAAAVATPAASDAGQGDAAEFAPAEIPASPEIIEAVVENPTPARIAGEEIGTQEVSLGYSENIPQNAIYVDTNGSQITMGTRSESPIEEKIHALVDAADLNGWHILNTEIVILLPPRNGIPVFLSETTDRQGVLAFWKRTRKFANSTHRWQESGKWIDFASGMDIPFKPVYWKERF